MVTRTAFPGTATTGSTHLASDDNKLPGGWIGYVEITADQTGITAETNITGLSVTVTVNTTRRLKLTAFMPYWISTVAGDRAEIRIKESTTILAFTESTNPGTAGNFGATAHAVITPSSGSHTYNVAFTRAAGTGSLTFGGNTNSPAFLLVEDVGPAS